MIQCEHGPRSWSPDLVLLRAPELVARRPITSVPHPGIKYSGGIIEVSEIISITPEIKKITPQLDTLKNNPWRKPWGCLKTHLEIVKLKKSRWILHNRSGNLYKPIYVCHRKYRNVLVDVNKARILTSQSICMKALSAEGCGWEMWSNISHPLLTYQSVLYGGRIRER